MTNKVKNTDKVWDFVEQFYPNYSSSDEILRVLDLDMILSGEKQTTEPIDYLKLERDEAMLIVYEKAIQGYIEQPDPYTIFLMAQIIQISKPDLGHELLWDEATRMTWSYIHSPFCNTDEPLYESLKKHLLNQGYSEQMQKQLTTTLSDEREPTYVLLGSDLVAIADKSNCNTEAIAEAINNGIGQLIEFKPDTTAGYIIESTIGWFDYLIIHGAQYREINRSLEALKAPSETEPSQSKPQAGQIPTPFSDEVDHRMGIIKQRADDILEFLTSQGLFDEDSEVWQYLNDINMATDLSNPECLRWTK